MDRLQEYLDWIDRYLGGRLTPPESDEFGRMLKEEAGFSDLLQEMEVLAAGIKESAREKLLTQMKGWEAQNPAEPVSPVLRFRFPQAGRVSSWALLAAASLIVILYVGIIRPPQAGRLANTIYRENYDGAYPNVIQMTMRADSWESPADRAFQAYDRERFGEAASIWSGMQEPGDTVLFYLGSAWLALGEHAKAADCFRQVAQNGAFLPDQSRWYLALALLKGRRTREAREVLIGLADSSSHYGPKALAITGRLKDVN
jgi:tetratricopeptide (TPR) repeat protein